ncbi:glycerate kinase [Halobacteriales archaeon QS_8_69_26]|nr:MAG: glycerate kinase [Halobacteriales archaeon QS_8_69_26]
MIRNREALGGTPPRDLALDCLAAGIEAAHPRRVIDASVAVADGTLTVGEGTYDLDAYGEVFVLGGGKAANVVAGALVDRLGDRVTGGAVVTDDPAGIPGVEVFEGGHPVPTEEGVEGARRVLELAGRAGEDALVLAVVTGGGSALMTAPAEGVALGDVRAVTDAMLDAGMEIHEINAVRKHCSRIKGGHLARAAAPATVVNLVFSDVVGNDPGVVASGPTSPDDSTFGDALAALDRYGVEPPAAVRDRLRAGAAGTLPETPDRDDPAFDRVHTHVLADGMTALAAAREVAREAGYATLVLSSRIRGEAGEVATVHVGVAEECRATGNPLDPPAVILSGGELTVTVRGDGSGGPSTEFATRAGLELAGGTGTTVAAVDTDGIDGRSDVAGGVVDGDTVTDRDAAREALADSDAATYLAANDAAVRTGPTGTNVNDLRVVVVEEE